MSPEARQDQHFDALSLEHPTADVYATQFHPEAAQFWFEAGLNRNASTIRVSEYFSAFLASRLRMSRNKFPDEIIDASGS